MRNVILTAVLALSVLSGSIASAGSDPFARVTCGGSTNFAISNKTFVDFGDGQGDVIKYVGDRSNEAGYTRVYTTSGDYEGTVVVSADFTKIDRTIFGHKTFKSHLTCHRW